MCPWIASKCVQSMVAWQRTSYVLFVELACCCCGYIRVRRSLQYSFSLLGNAILFDASSMRRWKGSKCANCGKSFTDFSDVILMYPGRACVLGWTCLVRFFLLFRMASLGGVVTFARVCLCLRGLPCLHGWPQSL